MASFDPIYTALGQQQRAQRKAAVKLSKLTPKRIDLSLKMYESELTKERKPNDR